MIVDVHCHLGFSRKPVDPTIPRFWFEPDGAAGTPGYDSYLSARLSKRTGWFFVRRLLKVDPNVGGGEGLDAWIDQINERHWSQAKSVDRLVLLAFDEYHDDAGRPLGVVDNRERRGSDLYVSNTLVRAVCATRPDRYLFGGSLHPYRVQRDRTACDMLEELARAGAVLVKWLPIHQNIRIDDARTVAFLRKAAEVEVPLLIHYGGEMSLSRQHMELADPRPMLDVLRSLRAEGAMPTVIVAHAATPSLPWQSAAGHRALVDALLGEFADAPLYADIAALSAFGRRLWLRRLAGRKELHRKLVWGSDYPIPVILRAFPRLVDRRTRKQIAALPSWIERSVRLAQAMGFGEQVFTQAARILRVQQ